MQTYSARALLSSAGQKLTICCTGVLQDREKGGFNAPTEEEYEDEEGNVYNKKTYEDLRRQGII